MWYRVEMIINENSVHWLPLENIVCMLCIELCIFAPFTTLAIPKRAAKNFSIMINRRALFPYTTAMMHGLIIMSLIANSFMCFQTASYTQLTTKYTFLSSCYFLLFLSLLFLLVFNALHTRKYAEIMEDSVSYQHVWNKNNTEKKEIRTKQRAIAERKIRQMDSKTELTMIFLSWNKENERPTTKTMAKR